MILLIFISVITTCIFLFLGLYALIINPKKIINLIVFIIALCLAEMAFGIIIIQTETDPDTIQAWYKAGTILTTVMHLLAVFFAFRLSKISINRIILWTGFILLTGYFIYFNILVLKLDRIIKYGLINGLVNVLDIIPKNKELMFYIFLGVTTLIYVLLLIASIINSDSRRVKKQTLILILSFSVSLIGYIVYRMLFFEVLKVMPSQIPGASTFPYLFWFIGIWYCIVRFRFLSLTPNLVGTEIFDNVGDFIFLLNSEYEPIYSNTKTKRYNEFPDGSLFKKIIEQQGLIQNLELLKKNEKTEISAKINIHKDSGNEISININISPVKDNYGDPIGFLIIGNEIKGFEKLKIIYGISSREIDIIKHVLTGSTNKDIARHLNISVNTVKAHLKHIYNKIGIDNKIQLLNIVISE